MITWMQSGPNGDLWIRKDGPHHLGNLFEHGFIFYARHAHEGLMLLVKDYLSLQERLKSSQYVLDEEVKENQRREAVIWQLETALRRRRAKLAKMHRKLDAILVPARGVGPSVAPTCELDTQRP